MSGFLYLADQLRLQAKMEESLDIIGAQLAADLAEAARSPEGRAQVEADFPHVRFIWPKEGA